MVLTPFWEMLIGRVTGPLSFRLIIQPLVAIFFAARYAISDVRAGRPPYAWAVISNPRGNLELLREGWKHVGKVFIAAVAIDLIYEVIVFRWIYPAQALIVAALLALLPYLLMRGLLNRFFRLWYRDHDGPGNSATTPTGGAIGPVNKGRT